VGVDFYLYFPSQDTAEKAAEALRSEGYAVVTRLGVDEVNWLALASREISEENLAAAEERMEALAQSLGGEFDGYERAVRVERLSRPDAWRSSTTTAGDISRPGCRAA
jgi:hypothetical protein